METKVELVASYWTIAGTLPGTSREYSVYDFEDRAAAAAAAGFKGMGLWHSDLEHILARTSLGEMRRVLEDNGITHVELEFLLDWFLDGELKRDSDIRKKMLLEAAGALGAKYVKVGDFHNRHFEMSRLIDSFAALCEEAASYGTGVAFEPMSSAMIHSLRDSLAMVEGAGAENGGLALDLWHMVNQAESYEELSRVPKRYLIAVEITDAAIVRDAGPNQRAGEPRKFCGEGDFDIKGFIDSVAKTGYSGAWGVEVISPELTRMSLGDAARKAFATAMAQFR